MVEYVKKDGWWIKVVFNNDMIGNIEGVNGVINNIIVCIFVEGMWVIEIEVEVCRCCFIGGEVDFLSCNLVCYIDKIVD